MSDRMVEMQSKLATALLTGAAKAFKVEPSIPGLITSMGGEPEKVFELVRFVQENGARLTGAFEAAVTQTAARVERMEIEQRTQRLMLVSINNMLCDLCERANIEHSGYLADTTAQERLLSLTTDAAE